MAGKKSAYGIGTLVILVVVFIVAMPYIRSVFARSFPEGFRDDQTCRGINCPEGEFCQNAKCQPSFIPVPK